MLNNYDEIIEIHEELDNIKQDIKAIQKLCEGMAKHEKLANHPQVKDDLITWCRELMGDSCNLYEEIEKRFGIDVYND